VEQIRGGEADAGYVLALGRIQAALVLEVVVAVHYQVTAAEVLPVG